MAGYDISASSSQSSTSGNRVATGPVQFAPVTVSQGGDKLTTWLLIGAAAIVLIFFLKGK